MTTGTGPFRQPDPKVEKDFLARVRSQPLGSRVVELVTHPMRSAYKVRDRWYECRHPEEPLLVPRAIRFLVERLPTDGVGFEWGSGGSTMWFARRCARVVSVEHAGEWVESVREQLRAAGLSNVDYRHVPEEPAEGYVRAIDAFDDGAFDFCLVDGLHRGRCVPVALPKVKPGGFLIVDDTHGMDVPALGVPAEWAIAVRADSGLKETTIWQRPR